MEDTGWEVIPFTTSGPTGLTQGPNQPKDEAKGYKTIARPNGSKACLHSGHIEPAHSRNGPISRDRKRLTRALLDRLAHHVHIREMNRDSFRLKKSRRKRDPNS